MFTADVLESRVAGSKAMDVDLLIRMTSFRGHSESSNVVTWLWEVLRSYSPEDQAAFLRFAWGRSRLPLREADFDKRFTIASLDVGRPDAYLPVSHTCFFAIDLPRYSTKQILEDKLTLAIRNCLEIDGDNTSSSEQAGAQGLAELE
jgi:hypothetical protein